MPIFRRIPLALLLIVPQSISAQAATRYELVPAETRVWFDADATMGRFRGLAQRVSGWAVAGDTTSLGGARGEIVVDAASFGTGVALRNRHLRTEMDTERYPNVSFALDRVTLSERAVPLGRAVTLHGRLTVKGNTRQVQIPAAIRFPDGGVVVDGDLATKFTELGMQPPTRMGGLTKVRDDLHLRFHAVFRRAAGS
jgi:polyisoprenoid-binding protein YceI